LIAAGAQSRLTDRAMVRAHERGTIAKEQMRGILTFMQHVWCDEAQRVSVQLTAGMRLRSNHGKGAEEIPTRTRGAWLADSRRSDHTSMSYHTPAGSMSSFLSVRRSDRRPKRAELCANPVGQTSTTRGGPIVSGAMRAATSVTCSQGHAANPRGFGHSLSSYMNEPHLDVSRCHDNRSASSPVTFEGHRIGQDS